MYTEANNEIKIRRYNATNYSFKNYFPIYREKFNEVVLKLNCGVSTVRIVLHEHCVNMIALKLGNGIQTLLL